LGCNHTDYPAQCTQLPRVVPDQLFTYKLGGRKPTDSGKSPTYSRHFAKIDNFQYFLTTKPLTKINFTSQNALKLAYRKVEFQKIPGCNTPGFRFKGKRLEGRREGEKKEGREGIDGGDKDGEWGSPSH